MPPSNCPLCGRIYCDHTPGERGQTYEEMMGDVNEDVVSSLWAMGPLTGADLKQWLSMQPESSTYAAQNLGTTRKTLKRWTDKKHLEKELPLWLEENLVARIRREARFKKMAEERDDDGA